MKYLAVFLLLSTAAFAADAPPQISPQDWAGRAALRAAVEREQLLEQIQEMQKMLQNQKAAAPATPEK